MSDTLIDWLKPTAFVIAGLIVGVLIDRVLVGRLRTRAEQGGAFYEELVQIIGRSPILWCFAGGIYLATLALPREIPANVEKLLNNGLFILLAFSLTAILARAAVVGVGVYTERVQGVLPSSSIFTNLVKLLVFLMGGLVMLQSLGISITPILTALGVGGLAVALALQDTLTNLFSGLQIIASRQFRPGDYIKLASGEEGVVLDITWRITTIQTLSLFTHVVPNSKLATVVVTNYNIPHQEMSILVPIGVSYNSDLDRVERVTIEVAREVMLDVEGGVPEYEPVVRFNSFGDSAINFNAVLRASEFGKQFVLKSEFVKRLHQRYQQEGIDIPFPIRTIQMAQDNRTSSTDNGSLRKSLSA